mmetsp:Transcript_11934/g.25938  ORF Transcript_11934/g.25938 Transcript_11934/m.25938 type:complete len:82 (-) Transcript_11934:719-964(-)
MSADGYFQDKGKKHALEVAWLPCHTSSSSSRKNSLQHYGGFKAALGRRSGPCKGTCNNSNNYIGSSSSKTRRKKPLKRRSA